VSSPLTSVLGLAGNMGFNTLGTQCGKVHMLPPLSKGALYVLLAVPVARALELPPAMRKHSQQPMIGPMPLRTFTVDSAGLVSEIPRAPPAESHLDPKALNNTEPLQVTESQPLVSTEWQGTTPVPETKPFTTTSHTLSTSRNILHAISPQIGKTAHLEIVNHIISKLMRNSTHESASNTTTDDAADLSIATANESASSQDAGIAMGDFILLLVLGVIFGVVIMWLSARAVNQS